MNVNDTPEAPDFGHNVLIFDPSMPAEVIQAQIDAVYRVQQNAQFGSERFALLFLPGEYPVDIPVGFYTEVAGLGAAPDAVHIAGSLRSDAYLPNNNATCNFWRGAANFSVTPTDGVVKWAVSQAVWFRQMHVRGAMVLHQQRGWGSGGWISNTLVDGVVDSGSQQQWISRNTRWAAWSGANWNMVFVGAENAPSGAWPDPPYTRVERAPRAREKPFLQVDAAGNFSVRLPALKRDTSGVDWAGGASPGEELPIGQFYVARAGVDTAERLNAQLAVGKHLLLTPGIYSLSDTLRVTRPDTLVLGLGFATLRPESGLPAMTVADVDGVTIAGVLFDAGVDASPVLLEVGTPGNPARHADNPIVLHDVFFRVGGAAVGKAAVSLRINAHDTIVDHTWVWRADHGSGVGWSENTAAQGLVVNGDNVIIYGLFVEHYQEFQVVWNGEDGQVYFYQSELPYDPPDQPTWTCAPGVNGWASYKVADGVTRHEAWGLGIYAVFRNPGVALTRAIEAPDHPGVRFHHIITVSITENGEISHAINQTGGATQPRVGHTPRVSEYP